MSSRSPRCFLELALYWAKAGVPPAKPSAGVASAWLSCCLGGAEESESSFQAAPLNL